MALCPPQRLNALEKIKTAMITLYGIPNCNSVKKTRVWLEEHGIAYQFHDFKKLGIDEHTLKQWLKIIPREVLVNKKGTTWRGLSADEQALATTDAGAIELMLTKTSVIKRPVVVTEKTIWVGHDEDQLSAIK